MPATEPLDIGPTSSLIGVTNGLIRHRILIIRSILLGALITGGFAFARAREYSVGLSFIPQEATPQGGLSALASDFGLALGNGASQSPAFYVELLQTRQILGRIADSSYVVLLDGKTSRQKLTDILVPKETNAAIQRRKAIKSLERMIGASYDLKTGVVNVGVVAEEPSLALQIAQRVLSEINLFNSETRQSQAHAERVYQQQQLREAKDSLIEAEARAQSFVMRNRVVINSPELETQKFRLDREVAMRQAGYQTANAAFQRARGDEVRNMPVITLVERPELPPQPEPRGVVVKTVVGAVLGAMFGLILAFVRSSMLSSVRSRDAELEEFSRLRHEIGWELRHPQRVLRSVLAVRSAAEPSPPTPLS